MNWYKKAQNIDPLVKLYHVTNPLSAQKIMSMGFDLNVLGNSQSFHFTNREGVKKWAKILQKERTVDLKGKSYYMGLDLNYKKDLPNESDLWKNIEIIEITIPKSLYDTLHRLGDDIFYSRGYYVKTETGKYKWIERNASLINGVNCKIRLLDQREVNELV